MDGVHDLGGMQGFGAVDVTDADDPAWGVRVHGVMLALAFSGNLTSQLRPFIETMDPVHYLSSSYYEHWIDAVERIRARADAAGLPKRPPVDADAMRTVFRAYDPPEAPDSAPPRFALGDRVVVTHPGSPGHTRCPRYLRAKQGTVVRVNRPENIPDEYTADPPVFRPEANYAVRFAATDLFPDGDPNASITVDLWESYLDGC